MQSVANKMSLDIMTIISQMTLNELEEIKNKIIERELYFKKFKKDKIENIMNYFIMRVIQIIF